MEAKTLQDKSTKELLKQEKLTKLVTGVLGGMLLALLVMAILLSFRQGFSTLVIIPFALMPILLINVKSLRDIKKELSNRGEQRA